MARKRHTDEDILKLLHEVALQLAAGDDDALRLAIIRLAKQYGRYGYPLAGRRLKSEC